MMRPKKNALGKVNSARLKAERKALNQASRKFSTGAHVSKTTRSEENRNAIKDQEN